MNNVRNNAVKIRQHGSTFFRRTIHQLGHLLFDRVSLVSVGFLILIAAAEVMLDLYAAVMRPGNDVAEMLSEVEGLSSVFLAVGLILKERRQLRLIFGVTPTHESPLEIWRDRLCLNMGLCLLLNATAMRLSAQLIRVPDRIIPTQGREDMLFAIGLLFCLLASAILSYLLLRLTFEQKKHLSL